MFGFCRTDGNGAPVLAAGTLAELLPGFGTGGIDYAAASGELLGELATAAEWQQLAVEIEAYRTSLPPKSWIADSLQRLLAARSP